MRIGSSPSRALRCVRTPTKGMEAARNASAHTRDPKVGPVEERAHGSEQERQGLVTTAMLRNIVRSAGLAAAILLLALAGSAGVRPF